MKLVLTDKPTGKEVILDADHMVIMEVGDGDNSGSHIVMSNGLGRQVVESLPSIAAAVGVTVPKVSVAVSAMSVALQGKPKKK